MISDDVDLVLKNTKLVNNGIFNATDGVVIFTGDATETDAAIAGNNLTTFYDLKIDKSANNVPLEQNITVSHQLNLQDGLLDLKDYNLNLGNSGYTTVVSGETYIYTSGSGMVLRQIADGSNASFLVGDGSCTPLTVNNSGTAEVFAVRVIGEVLTAGDSGTPHTSEVVNRTWFVEEATDGGNTVTLTTTWNASDEAMSFDRNNCYISHYDGGWDAPAPTTAAGSDPYQISRSGITDFSPFAVASGAILPVELLDFVAYKSGENVQLKWQTATEINNDYFEIQHSTNAKDFTTIGEVAGAGTTNELQFYDFLHKNPKNGSNYYRLRQVDLDGTAEYSDIRWVLLEKDLEVVVYPNPTSGMLFFETKNEIQEVRILDTAGRIVWQSDSSFAGVNLQDLASGIYVCEIHIGEKVWNKRIVKE